MTIDQETIDRLSFKLTAQTDSPLTGAERSLVANALGQLAASQATIAEQSRLLRLHGELRSRIDAIAGAAIETLRNHLDEPGPVTGYDADAADSARRELLAEIESANTTRATLAATLGFVRNLIGLRSAG